MDQEKRAKKRRMMMPRPKDILCPATDLRIVLLECHCGGECSVGNTLQFTIESIPTSHTESTVAGRQVTVITTPGWSNNGFFTDTPRKPKQEMRSVSLLPPGPHAFLLFIPADTTFTDDDERSIIDNLGFFGEAIWHHVIVLFTHSDWMGDTPI